MSGATRNVRVSRRTKVRLRARADILRKGRARQPKLAEESVRKPQTSDGQRGARGQIPHAGWHQTISGYLQRLFNDARRTLDNQ